jgi:ankyrin repeat protein
VEEILSEERIAGWNPVNAQDDEGLSAVMIAAQNGHVRLVKALITHGADLTLADKYGNTALSMAVSQGERPMVLSPHSRQARLGH